MRYAVVCGVSIVCVRVRGCVVWVCTVQGVYSSILCVQCVNSGVYCAYSAYNVFIACTMCSVFPFVARCMPAHKPRAMPPLSPSSPTRFTADERGPETDGSREGAHGVPGSSQLSLF